MSQTVTLTSWLSVAMATYKIFTNTSADVGSFRNTTMDKTAMQKTGFLEYLITGNSLVTARRMLNIPVQMFVSVISLVSNIINIVIFKEIGLSDSVTVILFGVAVADVGYAFFVLTFHVFDVLDAETGLYPFEPLKIVAYQAIWLHFLFCDVATALTVFNAVQQCACVAIPFIFKSIFTNFRARVIAGFIFIATFIIYLPNLLSPGTLTFYDDINNRTRLGNYFAPSNPNALAVFRLFSKTTLPFVLEVIIIFCTIVLSVKLKQAIQSRQHLTSNQNYISSHQATPASASKTKSSTKELQAIKTVTIVSTIFVICTLPDVLITVTGFFVEDSALLRLCSAAKAVMFNINTAANILIYLKCNSKYRHAYMRKFSTVKCQCGNHEMLV